LLAARVKQIAYYHAREAEKRAATETVSGDNGTF